MYANNLSNISEQDHCQLTGQLFKNRYQIEDAIGRGSFGKIYKVKDIFDPSK